MKKEIIRMTTVCLLSAVLAGTFSGCAGNSAAESPDTGAPIGIVSKIDPNPIGPDGYLDLSKTAALADGKTDDSAFFLTSPDVKGYDISGGVYAVNEETLRMLVKANVRGDGAVKWVKWKNMNNKTNPDPFTGVIPVSKLSDPIYLSSAMPSEAPTYMNRTNPSNLYAYDSKFRMVHTIGAIYRNTDYEIPDDAEMTICLGRTVMILHTPGRGWFVADDLPYPSSVGNIYYLPWTLEHTVGSRKLPADRLTYFDDHVEIRLTGGDLNGEGAREAGAEGSVLHFWGKDFKFTEDMVIDGCVTAFEVWVKEPEYAGKIAAALGGDWRDTEKVISQVYSGLNWSVTTERRLALGHNVGPERYDDLMDVEQVKRLLGIE